MFIGTFFCVFVSNLGGMRIFTEQTLKEYIEKHPDAKTGQQEWVTFISWTSVDQLYFQGWKHFVELGGLEPPSKHRTEWLSTRLVLLWFSSEVCRKTGQLQLIL